MSERNNDTVRAQYVRVRQGGDYEIEATGAIAFGVKPSSVPIIGMYKPRNGFTQDLGQVRVNADGTIQTTNGPSGKWRLLMPR
ncbi:MAG TPA: hypothetical protein V6C86_27030 [Oculatellaceae cyanobacterium]